MNSQRFTSILVGLAVVLGLLSALDVVTPETGDQRNLTTAEAARSGAWTCTAPGLAQGDEVTMVAAGAPGGLELVRGDDDVEAAVAIEPVGGSGVAAEVTYDRFAEGGVERVARTGPFPEQATETTVVHPDFPTARVEFGLASRWRRQPAAVGRVWERSSEFGPGGLLAAPCVPGSSALWVLPGLSTAGGAEATIVLSNPFASDASVTLTLADPSGPEQPSLLENVVVPAGSVRLLPLNEHAPERRDVGVVVRTRSGRVIVEALQSLNAAIGGVEGVSLVRAAPAGAETWTIPWVPTTPSGSASEGEGTGALDDDVNTSSSSSSSAGGQSTVRQSGDTRLVLNEGLDGTPSSWVWVTNVGEDDAVLLVTVHGPRGGQLIELPGPPLLAPGAIRRIDLDGLTSEARSAVTVATENGVPIVAAVGTQVVSDDEDRTGFTVQLGSPSPDQIWVLPGEAPAERQQMLALVNPGGVEATVAVSLWSTTGIVRPDSAQRVSVPAGTIRFVELRDVVDPALGTSVVFVQAMVGEVVAARVGFADDGPLELIVNGGVPSSVWRGGTLVPTTRYDPSLTGEVPVVEPTP